MAYLPSIEKLHKEYEELMADPNVTKLSDWTEINNDEPTDEEVYLEKIYSSKKEFAKKIKCALALGNL